MRLPRYEGNNVPMASAFHVGSLGLVETYEEIDDMKRWQIIWKVWVNTVIVARSCPLWWFGDYVQGPFKFTGRFACERLFVIPCIVDNNVICNDVVPWDIHLYGLYYK